jgi:acyl-CoA thioesterase FadM
MGHVNSVMYVRYAESARVNWALNYGVHVDPEHKREWSELASPRGVGMILKSIGVEYKFVRILISSLLPCVCFNLHCLNAS